MQDITPELEVLKDKLELFSVKLQSARINLVILKWYLEQLKCITDLKCKYEV